MYSGIKTALPWSILSLRLLMILFHFGLHEGLALPAALPHHYHHDSPIPLSFNQNHVNSNEYHDTSDTARDWTYDSGGNSVYDDDDSGANISLVKETVVHMIHVRPPEQQIDVSGIFMSQQQTSSSIQFLIQSGNRLFFDPLSNWLQSLFSSASSPSSQDHESEDYPPSPSFNLSTGSRGYNEGEVV